MRMDHPFILGFCQNLIFYVVFTIILNFLGKTHFLQLLSYFNSFVYLRLKYGGTPCSYFKVEFLFQTKNLIPKVCPYFMSSATRGTIGNHRSNEGLVGILIGYR